MSKLSKVFRLVPKLTKELIVEDEDKDEDDDEDEHARDRDNRSIAEQR